MELVKTYRQADYDISKLQKEITRSRVINKAAADKAEVAVESAESNAPATFVPATHASLGHTHSKLLNVVYTTTAYTVEIGNDIILADGTFTVTLPDIEQNNGIEVEIKNIGTGVITVVGASYVGIYLAGFEPGYIDKQQIQILYQYDAIHLVSNVNPITFTERWWIL